MIIATVPQDREAPLVQIHLGTIQLGQQHQEEQADRVFQLQEVVPEEAVARLADLHLPEAVDPDLVADPDQADRVPVLENSINF